MYVIIDWTHGVVLTEKGRIIWFDTAEEADSYAQGTENLQVGFYTVTEIPEEAQQFVFNERT